MTLKIDQQQFLDEIWQQKPLVIKQGLANFEDPLDEHDLAGLAQEADIDSRIVALHQNKWKVEQGPFESFEHLCVGKWTLMVQGVDRWIDEVNSLAKHFSFIPHWRFDDVMVSYSVPGAGVGPHVDQYDVFLLQGKGKRHWQVGSPDSVIAKSDNVNLQQVEPFKPIIDVVLEPGDILYIPPGWPHCGTTIEDTLTYSMGFRAPNARDLLQPINDALFNGDVLKRYTDGPLNSKLAEGKSTAHQVSQYELERLTQIVTTSFEHDEWYMTLLQHLSEQNLNIEPVNPAYTEEEILEEIHAGATINPVTGVRPITSDKYPKWIFINGERFELKGCNIDSTLALFDSNLMTPSFTEKDLSQNDLVLVCTWINSGLLLLE